MEIEIISKENVKPATPTPPHLRTYKLSILDQLMAPTHIPMVSFYANHSNDSPETISRKLLRIKESLSETLPSLYLFAGRMKDDLYVDCNDEGVHLVEARVNCSISDFLAKPDRQLIRQLVPEVPSESSGTHVAVIQVNLFTCGGIAIGTRTSHKIIDGPTSVTLVQAWSAGARRCTEAPIQPDFSAPVLFPQNASLPSGKMLAIWPSLLKFGKCVTRRFVFDASAIATIKASAASPSYVEHPTRVESVAAFMWKRAKAISKARYGRQRPSVLTHTVNLRGKKGMDISPISEHAIGNLIWLATAECSGEEADAELPSLVGLQRSAIIEVFVGRLAETLQGEEGFVRILERLEELEKLYSKEDTDYFMCSSVCKVGAYDADFGWGKPIWVCPGGIDGFVYQNLIFLVETPGKGDGIEVWVTMGEQDMAILEADEELLQFASMDPSPMDFQ